MENSPNSDYTTEAMRKITAILFMFVFAFSAMAADPPYTCTISTGKSVIMQGEVPEIKVSIANNSGEDVYLVRRLDGSDVGWRYPRCNFEVLDSSRKPVSLKPMGRCGNMNLLKASDFVKVTAGAKFDLGGRGGYFSAKLFRFQELPPGDYILKFNYQTSTKTVRDYFGDEKMMGKTKASPEIQKLFESVPLVNLASNELRISVQPK